ncbi:MAG: hypothetical protein JSV86_17175 [Gemmatimonadota bacterium]|nr:MAG: hypothetical protein JSV86_17175 [Gemmatimonadota bacterium]
METRDINVSGTVKLSNGFLTGLLLGILTGGIGMLAVVWFHRRYLNGPVGSFAAPTLDRLPVLDLPAADDSFELEGVKEDKVPVGPPSMNTPPREYAQPITESFLLPGPGGDAIRIASTTDVPYMVQVRPVDPPGAFAVLSFSPTELNIRGPGVAVPVGHTIIIPVGQWQTVPMAPNSALYARGNIAGVTLSVSGSPTGTGGH